MAKPTATEIKTFLEGFCDIPILVSDSWIEQQRDNFIIKKIEKIIRRSIAAEQEVTEYYDGTGENILSLGKPVNSLVSITYVTGNDYSFSLALTNFLLIPEEGIIKARLGDSVLPQPQVFFPRGKRNIKIVFMSGFNDASLPTELFQAIIYLTAEAILTELAGRSGGGDVSVTGYSKSYGSRGKYTDYRNTLARQGLSLLDDYQINTV